jgi:hypothetical protein
VTWQAKKNDVTFIRKFYHIQFNPFAELPAKVKSILLGHILGAKCSLSLLKNILTNMGGL